SVRSSGHSCCRAWVAPFRDPITEYLNSHSNDGFGEILQTLQCHREEPKATRRSIARFHTVARRDFCPADIRATARFLQHPAYRTEKGIRSRLGGRDDD
ncbi:hypothetical protein, partial [Rhodobium gokarnense]|uniref:hypothetical protein n=1 Tax=Rhodobium gokarnense TaxID=364296 RepID=UPI0022248838